MHLYYTQTPALRAVPKSERFQAYRAAHKALMMESASYRRHWHIYLWSFLAAAAITSLSSTQLATYSIVLFCAGLVAMIALILWQQNYQNTEIDLYLSRNKKTST